MTDYQIQRSLSGSTSTVVTETGLVKSGQGVLRGIVTTATSSGTLVVTDALETSTVAVGTITQSVGAGGKAVHGGSTLTSTGASVASTHASGTLTVSGAVNFKDAIKASAVLTSDQTIPTAGDTVTVGTEVYTFIANNVAPSKYNVRLGTTATQAVANLLEALKNSPVVDVVLTSTFVITVTAKTAGVAGNSIVKAESSTHLDWDGAGGTLEGGLAAETVTINTTVYTFKTRPEQAYDVLIGSTSAISLANLKSAINATAADRGIKWGEGTVAHPTFVAYTSDATTCVIKARIPGADYNAYATTETCADAAWGGATVVDGVTTANSTTTLGAIVYTQVDVLTETYGATAIPYQFLRGASEATMLDALKAAINGTSTGTLCSTGTVAHPYMIATTNADDSQVVKARTVGNAAFTAVINALPTTDTHANLAWTSTTINGGVTAVATTAATITINGRVYTTVTALSESTGAAAVADQILWVSDEATFLDNLKKAINGSGVAGTDYSTGTTANVDVFATTNSATQQVVQARSTGVAGNAITTTSAMTNYAWGAATLASGAGVTGKVLLSTYTPTAGSAIDLENLEFENGLFVTVGGTSISSTFIYK